MVRAGRTAVTLRSKSAITTALATPDHDAEAFAAGWAVLRTVLEDATHKLTRQELQRQWPQDHAPPSLSVLWAWLDRAVTSGQVTPERWPELSNVVAWSALQRGHPEAGLVWARAAVAGRPEEANFLDTLGQILLAQGEYAEAEAVLRQALAAQQRTSTRVALARTLAAQGQHAAAAVEAEEALAEHTGPWPGDAPGAQQVRSWMQEWRDSSGAAPASQRAAASATVLGSE